MTGTQSLKIYEILQRHFKNDADAKIMETEIEEIIDHKFENEKGLIATKGDIYLLKEEISLLRQDILKIQTEFEKRMNTMIMWNVGTGVGIVGLIFTVIKLFLVK